MAGEIRSLDPTAWLRFLSRAVDGATPESICRPEPRVSALADRDICEIPPVADARSGESTLGDRDVIKTIMALQKPGDVADWMARDLKQNPSEWSQPLSYWERYYLESQGSKRTDEAIRMRAPVDPKHLTAEEAEAAERKFGPGEANAERYANFENRRRIAAHYVVTHPATVRANLGMFAFLRDINPVHFALERGWQIGSGKEMFTGRDVSRLGAAGEFLVNLGLMKAMDVGIGALRPGASAAMSPMAGPEAKAALGSVLESRVGALATEGGTTAAGVVDPRTGKMFFATENDLAPARLHPLLADRGKVQLTPEQSAKAAALNQALYAREATLGRTATPGDLAEMVVETRPLPEPNMSRAPKAAPPEAAPEAPAPEAPMKNALTEEDVKLLAMVREMKKNYGDFDLGALTREEARKLGEMWVGPNPKIETGRHGEMIMTSKDGYRRFRDFTSKGPNQGYATRANLETAAYQSVRTNLTSHGWKTNGHIDLIEPP